MTNQTIQATPRQTLGDTYQRTHSAAIMTIALLTTHHLIGTNACSTLMQSWSNRQKRIQEVDSIGGLDSYRHQVAMALEQLRALRYRLGIGGGKQSPRNLPF